MTDDQGIVERMAEAVQEVACARVGITPVFPVPQLFTEDVQAAIAALDKAGYAIVPKEPTDAILDAISAWHIDACKSRVFAPRDCFAAILDGRVGG